MKRLLVLSMVFVFCFASFTIEAKAIELGGTDNITVMLGKKNNNKPVGSDFDDSAIGKFEVGFGQEGQSCKEVLGSSLVYLIKGARIAIQGIGCGIATASGVIAFVPAITNKDADALKKAFNKFVKILAIMALLLCLPVLLRLLGTITGFDLSCI